MPAYRVLCRYMRDRSGAAAIEYSLLAGMVAVALVGILAAGGAIGALYDILLAIADSLMGGEGGNG